MATPRENREVNTDTELEKIQADRWPGSRAGSRCQVTMSRTPSFRYFHAWWRPTRACELISLRSPRIRTGFFDECQRNNYLNTWISIIRIVNYETQLSWSSPTTRSFKILSRSQTLPIDSKASRREKKRNQVPLPQFISSYTYTHVHLHAYIVRFNSLIQGIGSVTRTPVSRRPSAL